MWRPFVMYVAQCMYLCILFWWYKIIQYVHMRGEIKLVEKFLLCIYTQLSFVVLLTSKPTTLQKRDHHQQQQQG